MALGQSASSFDRPDGGAKMPKQRLIDGELKEPKRKTTSRRDTLRSRVLGIHVVLRVDYQLPWVSGPEPHGPDCAASFHVKQSKSLSTTEALATGPLTD